MCLLLKNIYEIKMIMTSELINTEFLITIKCTQLNQYFIKKSANEQTNTDNIVEINKETKINLDELFYFI